MNDGKKEEMRWFKIIFFVLLQNFTMRGMLQTISSHEGLAFDLSYVIKFVAWLDAIFVMSWCISGQQLKFYVVGKSMPSHYRYQYQSRGKFTPSHKMIVLNLSYVIKLVAWLDAIFVMSWVAYLDIYSIIFTP